MPTHTALRFSRQICLPQVGQEGQQRLADSHALVIGLGGLGSAASLYLAGSGIGRLTLNDFDRVDATNLPRQILFSESDIDASKATVSAQKIAAANPEVQLLEIDRRLDEQQLGAIMQDVDIVLDCTDNFVTRGMINRACYHTGRALVSGAAIRFEGQLAVFRHDLRDSEAAVACYNCLYSEADENLENCAGQGILAPVAGTIGCMMATESIKRLLDIDSDLDGRLWIYDALAGNGKTISIRPRADCPVCSQSANQAASES